MEHGAAIQTPLFEIDSAEYAPRKINPFDLLTMFSTDNKDRLRLLQAERIPYVIYSGAHVAAMSPYGERPIGDMDVMIPPSYYDHVRQLAGMRGGQAYCLRPLPFWDEDLSEASFIMIGNMEIKANSDCTPGNGFFTLTDLVFNNRVLLEQHDPETNEPFRVAFAHPMETILFKTAMWRPKDQRDIDNLLAAGIMVNTEADQEYLCRRILETNVGEHVIDRLIQKRILLLNEELILCGGNEITEFLRVFHSQQISRLVGGEPFGGNMFFG